MRPRRSSSNAIRLLESHPDWLCETEPMPDYFPSMDIDENSLPLSVTTLSSFYGSESARIQRQFEVEAEGLATARRRSGLVDRIVRLLHQTLISPDPTGPAKFCLVALGGYGRQELFPHSDVDLLFLIENSRILATCRESIAALLRALWDLRTRVGHSTRTLSDCGRLHRDNLEFSVSLLDCRYLAGDPDLYAQLHDVVIPHLVARDHADLSRDLVRMTHQRHKKHGNTIFHLEPNIKETPGGIRDYHVCRWLLLVEQLWKQNRWTSPNDLGPTQLRELARQAFVFLATTRCFLHYLCGRDDNQLSYEAQRQTAACAAGLHPRESLPAEEWMRFYFRHARSINRLTQGLLDEFAPARAGLFGLYQDWRSRLSNPDFAVVRGRLFARQPAAFAGDLSLLLRLFEMVARHGLEIGGETERVVEQASARIAHATCFSGLWQQFRRILTLPYAAEALRAMHRLKLLTRLFPEFQSIDSLVIGDYYHRYTVDEHSFMAIQHLHQLHAEGPESPEEPGSGPGGEWERRFAEILSELEQPELLYFALLFHDVGKGAPETGHISLNALEAIMARLDFDAEYRETVRFLVANHLEMSLTCQRRDVFDPETIRCFATTVETSERLKMLCLLTYADIRAVSPEALSPWKAELLWQLYMATSNYLNRSVDEDRLEPASSSMTRVETIFALLHPPVGIHDLHLFLEGFPRRYLSLCTAEEVASHFEMARLLASEPEQVAVKACNHHYELTVVTVDRPYLFATLTGTLAAWGMNIIKADAFANAVDIVVDTLKFIDLHRTLELNPPEHRRFKADLIEALRARSKLQTRLAGRIPPGTLAKARIMVDTQVRFDDRSSSHSTLLELIAQDRPGLLYQVSSILADHECNIEVALVDTEGQRAIDVFYLTHRGAKLESWLQHSVYEALLKQL